MTPTARTTAGEGRRSAGRAGHPARAGAAGRPRRRSGSGAGGRPGARTGRSPRRSRRRTGRRARHEATGATDGPRERAADQPPGSARRFARVNRWAGSPAGVARPGRVVTGAPRLERVGRGDRSSIALATRRRASGGSGRSRLPQQPLQMGNWKTFSVKIKKLLTDGFKRKPGNHPLMRMN